MHLFNSSLNTRGLTLALLLVLLALTVASCSLVERPEEGSGAAVETPDAGASAADENGTIIISAVTVPAAQAGAFTFTGVPSGTISTDSTLVVADLTPGTYTTTQVNPAPDFDLTAVECDDGDSAAPSSGDAQTRTAVLNVDAGETIRCTFTNAQRGTLVVVSQTEPGGLDGAFTFTGSPTGTIPAEGTLVVANLAPGTYTTTEVDPAPDFDVTAVQCDDGGSPTPSSGDASSRTAVFNLDPGEMVTCAFTNTRRGTLVVANQVSPEGAEGNFLFTGVPSGTISANGTLVVANLTPGTYTTTEADPEPDFELTDVSCDDGGSVSTSSGDASTRTAIFNLDPGETVRCLFTNTLVEPEEEPAAAGGGAAGEGSTGSEAELPSGTNPFEDPDPAMERFPLPEDLPPDAGTYAAPKPGPWSVVNHAGRMTCDAFSLDIPASPPESGILEVLDGGQTLIGSGLQEDQASITMNAQPEITGRYTGAFEGMEQGVPVTINYFWQVVTDEYIVGFLTASVTSEGVSCEVYRSYELTYTG
jgi:hypothetical protein